MKRKTKTRNLALFEPTPAMIRKQETTLALMRFVRAICENSVNRAEADEVLAGLFLPDVVELARDSIWYTNLPVEWKAWTRK